MARKTKKPASEQQKLHVEIVRQMLTLATSGFGLVSALAWNSLIQEFVATYVRRWLPEGGQLLSLSLYAVIVTILAVFVTIQLSKLLRTIDPNATLKR
ncbi:MAG TPA: DUF5654 family protein [Candidatus Levybacteria bacterium]|nr:DUF5654 family protein [Candidatus Levybacteria bacterium]